MPAKASTGDSSKTRWLGREGCQKQKLDAMLSHKSTQAYMIDFTTKFLNAHLTRNDLPCEEGPHREA